MSTKPQVEYRRLGECGLRVSVPILGAMSIGDPKWGGGWVIGEAEALPLLKYAYDRGINTWDTANIYSNGVSEILIAKAIKKVSPSSPSHSSYRQNLLYTCHQKYNIPRSKLVILTKCSYLVDEDDISNMPFLQPSMNDLSQYVNQAGLSRQAIFNAVNASLARLETDYIDLFQIHRFDPNTPVEETMEALHDLVKMGKVRYIGASSMWTWQFQMMNHVAEMRGWTKFVSMQNLYSLLYREEEREMNAYCNHEGMGLIPYSPLAGGILARPLASAAAEESNRTKALKGGPFERKTTDADSAIVSKVEEFAKNKGWTMAQISLAWINAKVSSPIVGFNKKERVDESIIPSFKLTEEEIKELESPYVPVAVAGHF